jgi:cytochrome oxidase Cu insertion factor (SCO1/SenC/PrrC family)
VRGFAGAPIRAVAGIGALGVILVGAAPMAFATTNPNADPITAQAIAGTAGQFDTPAANFTLTSQDGQPVSLASLRGKVVLLTFLDPVCTTDCPLIAQEMRAADSMLGAKASDTELVAVVANPTYLSTAYTRAFTDQENLGQVPNWLYLTGSLNQLKDVWHDYGIEVENLPAGAMAAHNDLAFVIDADGNVRQEISDDPGPGTSATTSSFAGLLADSVLQTMSRS